MDLCLECKGCKAECRANVDMAKLKYEFLHHYYQAHGLPLRNRLFGRIERLNRLGARLPRLFNALSGTAPSRWLLEKLAGGDRRRPLPPLAEQTFTAWFARHAPPAAAPRAEGLLFHHTLVTYTQPSLAPAAVDLLPAPAPRPPRGGGGAGRSAAAAAGAGSEAPEGTGGWCGRAGSVGFARDHNEVWVTLGTPRRAPAVKAAPADTVVVAPGISCRQQIEH